MGPPTLVSREVGGGVESSPTPRRSEGVVNHSAALIDGTPGPEDWLESGTRDRPSYVGEDGRSWGMVVPPDRPARERRRPRRGLLNGTSVLGRKRVIPKGEYRHPRAALRPGPGGSPRNSRPRAINRCSRRTGDQIGLLRDGRFSGARAITVQRLRRTLPRGETRRSCLEDTRRASRVAQRVCCDGTASALETGIRRSA